MREIILILAIILALAWAYKDIEAKKIIIEKQDQIISKIEYQNYMIANTVQKSLEQQFQQGLDCNLIDN